MTNATSKNFWHLNHPTSGNQTACTDGKGRSLTYSSLDALVVEVSAALKSQGARQLGFIFSSNTIEWLCIYLACLQAGHVPLLLPSNLQAGLVEQLLKKYEPNWVWQVPDLEGRIEKTYQLTDSIWESFVWRNPSSATLLHPDLGLLLSTSGSTGSSKLVRLSYRALSSNAVSIASYLDIRDQDKAMTTLPPNYSYGLSVINSHLAAGASVVMSDASLMSRDFLKIIQTERITSLAGVPTWYQMLLRVGFDKAETPSLRILTQAGGALNEKTKVAILNYAKSKGLLFYVMYGQTEASPRMSYVPPEVLSDNLNSIGIPIPEGSLRLDEVTNELIFCGPNVMMGYAESRADLGKGDELCGELRTGDVGAIDSKGFFSITGRLKRFIKLSGNRFGLDEIENELTTLTGIDIAVTGRDERMGIWIEGADSNMESLIRDSLLYKYQLHHSLYRIYFISEMPLLDSKKKDYMKLLQLLD